jgi:hypothetical protein
MNVRAEKPFTHGPWTLGGLITTWWHSNDETLKQAALELERVVTPLEERIVKNFREARRIEMDRSVFGCGVREEAQIRQAVRREIESQWAG